MSVTTERLTVEEFSARDFPRGTQLVNGEVVVNDPALRHQRIAVFVLRRLADWADAEPGRGEAGVGSNWVVGPRSLFIPDVWWVTEAHRPARDVVLIGGSPDLVVEVRSASTWRYDVGPKREAYARTGALELWLVDTESDTVIVNRRSNPDAPGFDVLLELGADEMLESPLLPGFALSIDELFDR
jgi:Uma2 family endonuclease